MEMSFLQPLFIVTPSSPGPRTFDQRSLCQIYLHTCYYTYTQQVLKLAKIKQNCLGSIKQNISVDGFDSSAIGHHLLFYQIS